MNILESIISGVVQGLTEFFPISSSGHLVMLHTFFGYTEPRVLEDVLLHAGTLIAIIIFFRKDIFALFRDLRTVLLIGVGTIPIVVVGYLFADTVESLFTSTKVVGISLLVTGTLLLLGSFFSRTTHYAVRNTKLSFPHAILIGIAQAAALIPGISRSGATISTALLLKKRQDLAFKFSFLLSIPAILGALVYKMKDLANIDVAGLQIMIWGSFVACITGIAALWFLRWLLIKGRLYYFSIYCFLAGLILLIIS